MLPGNSLHLFLLVSLCFFLLSSGYQVFQWHYNGQYYMEFRKQPHGNELKECVFFYTEALSEILGVGGMTKKR